MLYSDQRDRLQQLKCWRTKFRSGEKYVWTEN